MIISVAGYIASVLLGISLLVNNDLKFRWLNTFGCFTFIIYGVLINALPVILTNTALFFINVFYLIKIYKTEEAFDIAEFKAGDNIIGKFLQFYQKDIRSYFPRYSYDKTDCNIRFIVLRDMVIANIFEAALQPDGTAIVHINYTVPKYRDYKVGKFIFDKEKSYLNAKGVQQILYTRVDNKSHETFLKAMKFSVQTVNGTTAMVKKL